MADFIGYSDVSLGESISILMSYSIRMPILLIND